MTDLLINSWDQKYPAEPEPEPEPAVPTEKPWVPVPLENIPTLTGYLRNYGKSLAKKAIKSLRPLHLPGRDPLPDFEYYPDDRVPLEAQQHIAAATIRALDKHGATFT